MNESEAGLVILRFAAAAWLLLRGVEHATGPGVAVLAGAELLSGACLLVGLRARLWAAVAAGGLAPLAYIDEGPQAFLLMALLVYIALTGPGPLSVDAFLLTSPPGLPLS